MTRRLSRDQQAAPGNRFAQAVTSVDSDASVRWRSIVNCTRADQLQSQAWVHLDEAVHMLGVERDVTSDELEETIDATRTALQLLQLVQSERRSAP